MAPNGSWRGSRRYLPCVGENDATRFGNEVPGSVADPEPGLGVLSGAGVLESLDAFVGNDRAERATSGHVRPIGHVGRRRVEFHARWYSGNLGRDMEMLVFGYSGARVRVFPTSKGRYYEWEDRGMIHSMSEPIERGHDKVFCSYTDDEESW